ncbi:MAG: phosphopantothenoylcysteine decarboxylase, partial [Rhodobacterales bacterium]|nr:phosphopantothenoylcysteine decarboxylase [Rhodobacterales bacterium]
VNAKNKLEKKQLDAIILNSISDENTCFNSDKNKIHFITKSKTKKFKLKFKNE